MTDERKALLDELRIEETKDGLVRRLPDDFEDCEYLGVPFRRMNREELLGVIHCMSPSVPFLVLKSEEKPS